MNPAAWARLVVSMAAAGSDAADALDQLKAEGRRILAARDAELPQKTPLAEAES